MRSHGWSGSVAMQNRVSFNVGSVYVLNLSHPVGAKSEAGADDAIRGMMKAEGRTVREIFARTLAGIFAGLALRLGQ